MINVKKVYNDFEKTAHFLLGELNKYSLEQILQKPDEKSWSLGQLYNHLTLGTFNFNIKNIRKCIHLKENKNKSKSIPGILVFFIGTFPPFRFKVVDPLKYNPAKPESIAEIKENLSKLVLEMNNIKDDLISEKIFGKEKHPVLGYLNSYEWYKLIEMHFRHHLRQKERVEKKLGIK